MDIESLRKMIELQYEIDEKKIELTHKCIDECIGDHVHMHLRWEILNKKAKYLLAQSEADVEHKHALAFSKTLNNSQRAYSTTEAKTIANLCPHYINAIKERNEINSLYQQTESILKVIDSRKWLLKNLSDLIVAGGEKFII